MNKDLIYRYVAIFAVIIETFTLIQGYTDIPDIAVMGGVVLLSMFFYPFSFINKHTYYFFLLVAVVLVTAIAKSFVLRWYLLLLINWLFSLSMINVFLYNKDWVGLKLVVYAGLLVILISSISTITILIIDPMIVRQLALDSLDGDTRSLVTGQKMGIVSYGLIHGLPTLLPALVYLLKTGNNIQTKIIWLSIIIVFYTLVLKASFATSLILSTLILLPSLIISKNTTRSIFLLVAILLMFLPLFNEDILINNLEKIKPFFSETEIEEKISDIQLSVKFGDNEGQLGTRGTLYADSWNSFFKEPIWGSMKHKDAGGHAFIADFLAWFGIIGAAPLILFLLFFIKKIYSEIQKKQKLYFLLSLIPFFVLSFAKGTPYFEQMLYLLLFLPGLYLMKTEKN